MNQKQLLRRQFHDKIQKISNNLKKEWSNEIFKQFINLQEIKQSKTISIYYATDQEVSTKAIIEYLLKQKKRVCLPKIDQNNQMQMIIVDSLDGFFQKKHGIFEPVNDSLRCFKSTIDCIVVPGIAFDLTNYRLGKGQGHYDQYLQNFDGKVLMLAFEMQKIKNLPKDWWDVVIPSILTEKTIYKV